MQRREFIISFGGGAAAWPFVARAQQPTMPVIAWVAGGSHNNTYERYLASFRQGLSEVGFAEGRDFTIEYYWAQGEYDRLSWLVAGLVEREVAVIVALGDVAARAAKLATSATPIVFGSGSDPVKIGLVSNLSRPDTNLTGVSVVDAELESKKLELLKEVVPRATTIAFLVNPDGAMTEIRVRDMRAAARARGLGLHVLNARTKYDRNAAFAKFGELAAGAMAIASESVFTDEGEILGQLAKRYNVPAIAAHREYSSGRADELRDQPFRCQSPNWQLRRPHSQGSETCRPACSKSHDS
jgi:ABC-type uncharacterized transport system substrate-binding protein